MKNKKEFDDDQDFYEDDEEIINKQDKRKGFFRKGRHRKIKLIIGIVFALVFGSVIAVWPDYKDIKEKEFDAFAKIDDGAFHKAGSTVIYDKDGKRLGTVGNEKYYYTKISNISPYITKGYVSKEDKSFYTHHGVSWKGTLRAAVKLVLNGGKATQGGSTITQQVVKNCLLSQEKTYERKVLEILTAYQVERQYSKAQIMEFYCNTNYYGNGCYGVEGASIYYFGKRSKNLTLGEAAMLVGVSNLPNVYNPVASYSKAMAQKKIVVNEMLEDGAVTKEQADAAIAEKPEIVRKSEKSNKSGYLVSYALHCATLKLMNYDKFTFRYSFKSSRDYKAYRKKYNKAYSQYYQRVRSGGYAIRTSLDQKAQKQLQKAVDKGLKSSTEKTEEGMYALQGAAVCVDNSTHMVIAAVGGREEKGDYNRAFQAERQPGSSIKPLLDYGPAFNEGVLYNGTPIKDSRITVSGFTPKNYDNKYHGTVTAREALVHSYNIPAMKAYQMTGRKTAMSYLQKMQFSSLTYTDQRVYAVSIGGFTRGATVEDMARGYATIADGGGYSENTCITKMSSFAEGTVYQASKKTKEVYNEDTSFMLTDILEGTFEESFGVGYGKSTGGQHYAAKTGTTNSSKDMWLCGYSKYYTTALWIGYDTPRKLNISGKKRADIWLDFMNSLHKSKNKSPAEFTAPSTTKLRNSSGSQKNVSYTKKMYSSRPSGWDYMSTIVQKLMYQKEEARAEKARIKAAEKAVSAFEKFTVNSYADASQLASKYQKAYDIANAVTTVSKHEEFITRLQNRYDILNKTVSDKWTKATEAYSEEVQEKKDAESLKEAQESAEKAEKSTEESRVNAVEYYIDALNDAKVYTSVVETIISRAESALANCTSYDSYSSLKSRLQQAETYARGLPKSSTSSSSGTESSDGSASGDGSASDESPQSTAQNSDAESSGTADAGSSESEPADETSQNA